MSLFDSARSPWTGRVLSVLRIVAGMSFMLHGTQKMFGFPAPMPGGMTFNLMSQMGLAGVLETFGGLAIVLGLLTRPVAFLLSGEMAVAYFQAHFPKSFYPTLNGGEAALLYCFIFLYFMLAGAGPWSIDAMISRAKAGNGSPETARRSVGAAA